MLAFIDQSGNPHPNDPNSGAVLLAVCMRESTFFELSRVCHAIKGHYKWVSDGVPREIHAVECASQRSYRKRNRPEAAGWKTFRAWLTAALRREVAVLMVVMSKPKDKPRTPHGELPSQYFFLLQRVEALAARWREAHVTVIFDEEGRQRDRQRAFAYGKLIQGYWEGRYFARLVGVPLFGDSAANIGLELADVCAYTAFIDKFRSSQPLDPQYKRAINELARAVYAKSPYLWDFHNRNEYHGVYRMPVRFFYSRVSRV